jgi:splicing factor 3A subunit 1
MCVTLISCAAGCPHLPVFFGAELGYHCVEQPSLCVMPATLHLQVVKDYKRTATGQEYDPTKYVVSPITGELVPLAEMQEHMRINLIDPKWKDQREAMLAKIKETTKASDTELMANLTRLAGMQPKVFGSDVRELSGVLAGGPGPIPRDGPTQLPKPTAKGGKPTLAPLPAAPAGASMNRSMHQPPGPAPPAGAPPGLVGAMPPPPQLAGGLPPVPPAGGPLGPPPMGAPPQKRPMPPTELDPKKPKTS